MVSIMAEIYTDGSAAPTNPGPAGVGYIIRYWSQDDKDLDAMPEEQHIEGKQGFRVSTNNRAEIMAAIYGLQKMYALIESGELAEVNQVNVYSDSSYIVNAVRNRWIDGWQRRGWMTSGMNGKSPTPVKNRDLWEQLVDAMGKLRQWNVTVTFNQVKGHAGNRFNEMADKLATSASADRNDQLIDEQYEKSAQMR